jgi:hypothetical protein
MRAYVWCVCVCVCIYVTFALVKSMRDILFVSPQKLTSFFVSSMHCYCVYVFMYVLLVLCTVFVFLFSFFSCHYMYSFRGDTFTRMSIMWLA